MAEDARISTALPSHPKTRKLRKRLGPSGCWSLICLFLWVAANRWNGDLNGLSNEDIELAAEWDGEPEAFVGALVEVGFLDGEALKFTVHDWHEHNPWAAARGMRIDAARKAAAVRWERRPDAERMPSASEPDAGRIRDAEKRNAHHPTQPNPTKKQNAPAVAVALPDWVPTEPWNAFLEMRKRSKSPMTAHAITIALRDLGKLRVQGQDAGAVLDQSTMRGWKGLFPVKTDAVRSISNVLHDNPATRAQAQMEGD